jgi:membrane-bound lytic murein transglycosylase D
LSKYEDINELSFAQKQARIGKTVAAETSQPVQPLTAGEGFIIYTVKQGDTIWDILKKYPGVTESEVKQWNNLTDAAKIKAGQQLKIRPKS